MVYTSLIHPVFVFPTFLIFTLLLFVSPARVCFDEIRTRTTSHQLLPSTVRPRHARARRLLRRIPSPTRSAHRIFDA
ncbi:hypothetical protein C8R44DRAFT_774360 [Mycena epipterygia]|nr:hypothetical protein C8R44DRAFT_774360 [Mycena epipterygia]